MPDYTLEPSSSEHACQNQCRDSGGFPLDEAANKTGDVEVKGLFRNGKADQSACEQGPPL